MASLPLPKTHTARGVALTVVAIAVAVAAQGYLVGHEFLLDGVFLYAVALILGFRFLPRLPVHTEPDSTREPVQGAFLRADRPSILLGVGAVAMNILVLALLGADAHRTLALILFAVSATTAPPAVWAASGRPRLRPFAGWELIDVLALAAILLAACGFRLYRLDSQPSGLWWDEAFSGLQVLKIMTDPGYRPVYVAGMAQEPSLIWYVMIPFFKLFGASPLGLRMSAVAGGLLGVLAISLLARELFGRRAGLVAGAIVAVMAWHVNFSRIAFNAVWSVAFDALAAYFLIQGMRTGRLLSFALAGTSLGLGLNMYYTTRLLPLILLLYLGRRLVAERSSFFSHHLHGLLIFGLVALITASPLVQFAIQRPEEFNSRFQQVSVLREVDAKQSLGPLVENLRKHLLMFHYEGDGNGRHNLPRAPMLDQAVAALFALGLLMAVRQIGRPECFLLLSWVAVMLSGGVLSLPFEAPQGLRTIDETSAVAILAALPLVGLWGQLREIQLGEFRLVLPPGSPCSRQLVLPVTSLVLMAILGGIAALNYQRYFVQQATDFGSWSAFSTAETEIARQVNALGPEFEVFLGETFTNNPTIQFLTHRKDFPSFQPAADLPLKGIGNVAIFLEPDRPTTLSLIRHLYPQAETRSLASPGEGRPILYEAIIRRTEIAALQGLAGSYFENREWAGEPVLVEHTSSTRFQFSALGLPQVPFSAAWRGTLVAPQFGRYLFKLEGPPTAELFVDEHRLAIGGEQQAVVLAQGRHSLRIRAIVADTTPIALLWQPPNAAQLMPVPGDMVFVPPVSNNGLLGSYYRNRNWEGDPAFQRIDPFLDMYIHLLPLPRPYSVEWRGKIDLPRSGTYSFATESADTSWVYVDERLVVTNEGANRQLREGTVQLDQGLHDLRVRFCDETGHSFIRVYWTPPGGRREPLPTERLYPPQGSYRQYIETGDGGIPGVQPGAPSAMAPGSVRLEFLGTLAGGEGHLVQPRDVAMGLDGRIYVADNGAKKVAIFTPGGEPAGELEGEFVEPFGVAVAPGGHLLVLDSRGKQPILMFTPDGKALARMGGEAGMYSPRGIHVDPTGAIYLADTGRSRVLKLSPTGQIVREYRGGGQLAQPVSVTVAGDGTIYVVDAEKHQLWVLDEGDAVLRSWSLRQANTFDAPHVALGSRGEVYVSDPTAGTIRIFDPVGNSLGEYGALGGGDAQFRTPTGLQVDARGQLWVADTGNQRVQRWIAR